MELAMIIVSGVVLTTLIAAVGDYLTKTKLAKATANPPEVEQMARRIEALERRLGDQEAKVILLEENVTFTTKLLEEKRS